MKKLWTLALAAGLLALSGCSDAVAEISNGSEVVFSVGDRSVTREDMFTTYKSSGASYIIQEATRYIVDQEVETTEEMEKQAQEELDNFKNTYGDQSESYIKLGGYQDENDYRDRYLLLTQDQAAALCVHQGQFQKPGRKISPDEGADLRNN